MTVCTTQQQWNRLWWPPLWFWATHAVLNYACVYEFCKVSIRGAWCFHFVGALLIRDNVQTHLWTPPFRLRHAEIFRKFITEMTNIYGETIVFMCAYIHQYMLLCINNSFFLHCYALDKQSPHMAFEHARLKFSVYRPHGPCQLDCNEPTNDNRCILIIKCLCVYTSENDRDIRPIRKVNNKTATNKTYTKCNTYKDIMSPFYSDGNQLNSPLQRILSKMTPIHFQSLPYMQPPPTQDGKIM